MKLLVSLLYLFGVKRVQSIRGRQRRLFALLIELLRAVHHIREADVVPCLEMLLYALIDRLDRPPKHLFLFAFEVVHELLDGRVPDLGARRQRIILRFLYLFPSFLHFHLLLLHLR